jgi:hypothetical protein
MTDNAFPRRDGDGRVVRLGDLLGAALGSTAVGLLGLLAIDGLFSLFGSGRFGQLSGWFAAALPAWVFGEEVRAWRVPGRFVMVGVCAILALILGVGAVAVAGGLGLAPIWSGAIGATVAVVTYGWLWYVGIRWLAGRGE